MTARSARGRADARKRTALPAGDYAVVAEGDPIASVERKTLENLAASLSDGTLAFQMQRLAAIPSAAVLRAAGARIPHV